MNELPRWTEVDLIVQADPDLDDLIPLFLEHRHEDVGAMRVGLASGDFERLRVLAHNMRGAGGGYGFEVISALGKYMEDAAKTQDSTAIANGVDSLEEYLAQVQVEYD